MTEFEPVRAAAAEATPAVPQYIPASAFGPVPLPEGNHSGEDVPLP